MTTTARKLAAGATPCQLDDGTTPRQLDDGTTTRRPDDGDTPCLCDAGVPHFVRGAVAALAAACPSLASL
jgi:hypothetical protein